LKTKDGAKSEKKTQKDEKNDADPTAPEVTSAEKEEILTDFRSAVGTETAEEGDDEKEKKADEKEIEIPKHKPLNPANRLVIRCINCGHFLFEVIAEKSYQKALCRQAECKALNEVIVEGNTVHITVTRRADRERGTMRF